MDKPKLYYRISDSFHEFNDGELFESKLDVIKALADFHDNDFSGVDENDEPYQDIEDFLLTLEDEEARLNWLLEHGQWEIEEIIKLACVDCGNIIIINYNKDIPYCPKCDKKGMLYFREEKDWEY